MPARHRSRQRALQVLFLWDQRKQAIDEAIHAYYETLSSDEPLPSDDDQSPPAAPDEFMEILVRGASEHAAGIDRRISGKSDNWRIERMPAVDRNILRLAVYEMSQLETPAPVVIDEALELARQFSGDESVSFINGVLDAVHKDATPKDALHKDADPDAPHDTPPANTPDPT
jgi:N utilization substance protein B